MTEATNIVVPDNKEVVAGSRANSKDFRVETAANVMNARLVMRGTTNDGDIVVATDEVASALGWVVRDYTIAGVREDHDNRTLAYDAGDIVSVFSGAGNMVVARVEAAVNMGDKLVPGTAGMLKAFSSDAANVIVAKSEMTTTAAGFIVVQMLI